MSGTHQGAAHRSSQDPNISAGGPRVARWWWRTTAHGTASTVPIWCHGCHCGTEGMQVLQESRRGRTQNDKLRGSTLHPRTLCAVGDTSTPLQVRTGPPRRSNFQPLCIAEGQQTEGLGLSVSLRGLGFAGFRVRLFISTAPVQGLQTCLSKDMSAEAHSGPTSRNPQSFRLKMWLFAYHSFAVAPEP